MKTFTSRSSTPHPIPRRIELRDSTQIFGITLRIRLPVKTIEDRITDFLTPSFLIILPPIAENIAPENTSALTGIAAIISGVKKAKLNSLEILVA